MTTMTNSTTSQEPLETMRDALLWAFNPLSLPLAVLLLTTALKSAAEGALDALIVGTLAALDWPKLPSRLPQPIIKGLERLEMRDCLYLFLNSFVECAFIYHLLGFALGENLKLVFGENITLPARSGQVPLRLEEITLSNTVLAVYSCFIIDDFFYYFLHRFLHLPAVYPWVHKHHHRQALPRRGYVDAANEHPLEQVGGLGCVWIAVQLTSATLGFHGVAIVVFFGIYASFAMLNHTPYDVQLPALFGLGYSVRAHEMHHRIPRSNYAQNTMYFDRVFGTFIPYRGRPEPSSKLEDAAAVGMMEKAE